MISLILYWLLYGFAGIGVFVVAVAISLAVEEWFSDWKFQLLRPLENQLSDLSNRIRILEKRK